MSKKDPTLFEVVYTAFGKWSPGGYVEDAYFVLPKSAKLLPNFEAVYKELCYITLDKLLNWRIAGFKVED